MKAKGAFTISGEEYFKGGQIIFKEGGAGDALYIVVRGTVEISRNIKGGKFIIEKIQPGDLFGEIEFIGEIRRVTTARAVGETTLGVVDRNSIKKELGQLSKQFKSILETIPVRLKKVIDRACDIASP